MCRWQDPVPVAGQRPGAVWPVHPAGRRHPGRGPGRLSHLYCPPGSQPVQHPDPGGVQGHDSAGLYQPLLPDPRPDGRAGHEPGEDRQRRQSRDQAGGHLLRPGYRHLSAGPPAGCKSRLCPVAVSGAGRRCGAAAP